MNIRRWIVTIVACMLIGTILVGFKIVQINKEIAYAESFPEHSESVKAAIAKQIFWGPTIKVMGEVEAFQSMELRNELEGKITKFAITPGSTVKKNQILVQLDVSQEHAQLRGAIAQFEMAQLEFDRYQRLIEQQLISKEHYDQAKAQVQVTRSKVLSLQAIIAKKTLKAPFDAKIGLHNLQVGQYLASNTLLALLVGVGTQTRIDFYLPQEQATLEIGTPVIASALGLLSSPITGAISAIDAAVTRQSRNLRYRAVFSGITNKLKPGVIVDVKISATQKNHVTILPTTAVRGDQFGAHVYVLSAQEQSLEESIKIRAKKRPVKLGPIVGNNIIITEGIEVGEYVATDGSYKLYDGILVKLNNHHISQIKTTALVARGGYHEK